MLFEEANQLLEPGYTPLETGYHLLTNGQMHVALLTRMPGCKGKMVDWWFGYLDRSETYQMWEPKSHISLEWDDHWQPGYYIGASHIVEGEFGGLIKKIRIHFHDPSEFLDTSKFEGANVGAAICANAYDLEKVPYGRIIHFVRDTDFGCEMRSRFWLFHATGMEAMRLIQHCMEEMGHLADFLPDLYKRDSSAGGHSPDA
jgi:hypothetical protein